MRLILNLTASLMILAAAAAQAQAADPYQWVGYTTNTFDGSGNGFGFVGMTTQCRADFGPGARMCKSSEYMDSDTLNPIGIPVDGAWLRPSWQGFVATSNNSTEALDESGVSGPTRLWLSCNGWTGLGSQLGMSVAAGGGFAAQDCEIARPVTCCKPTPVPAPSASLTLPIGTAALAGLSMLKGGA